MAASFPTTLKSFTQLTDLVNEILATHHNQSYDEIEAIEALLQAYDGKVARYIEGWVTDSAQNPSLGTIAADCIVTRVTVFVVEAFDDSGTDLLDVGYDGNTGAYVNGMAVDEIGEDVIASPGSVDSSARAVEAYYTGQNADAAAGKALVIVEYMKVTATPA